MIDIIIPVYNTPIKDLERCFDSIKKGTYKDYQVRIINDGSKKEIEEFLNEYCSINKKFSVKHMKNNGVSHARNVGIDWSISSYLTFIDSDDTIDKNFLKEGIKYLEENDLDIISGGYQEIKEDQIIRKRQNKEKLHIYEKEELKKYLDKVISSKLSKDNQELEDSPTGRICPRIYKRSSIGTTRFQENIKISEDTLFIIDLLRKGGKIGVVPNIWYSYYQNDYSTVHKEIGQKELNNLLDFFNEINIRMEEEKDVRIKNAYKMRILKTCSDLEKTLLKINPNIFQKEIIKNSIENIEFDNYLGINKYIDFYHKYFSKNTR